jgi:toxin FitB
VKCWLLDTNVISALINAIGAPSVKKWVQGQNDSPFCVSVLRLGEYEKGIHGLLPNAL